MAAGIAPPDEAKEILIKLGSSGQCHPTRRPGFAWKSGHSGQRRPDHHPHVIGRRLQTRKGHIREAHRAGAHKEKKNTTSEGGRGGPQRGGPRQWRRSGCLWLIPCIGPSLCAVAPELGQFMCCGRPPNRRPTKKRLAQVGTGGLNLRGQLVVCARVYLQYDLEH